MILYLAAIGRDSWKRLYSDIIKLCPNIGVLCSFAVPYELYNLIEFGFKNIMVDSGAYSVSKRGLTINLDEYIEYLKQSEEKITVAVALDVIGSPEKTCENWRYMQSKEIKNLMPTYHLGEDTKWLDLYCDESEFVGIGGIANSVTNWKLYYPFLKRIVNKYPNHKFHAFGLNSYRALRMTSLYSCDATSWNVGGRFAQVYTNTGLIRLRGQGQQSEIWKTLERDWEVYYSDFEINKHDYYKLNLFNIKFLYDLISNHQEIDVSEHEELF